MASVLVAGVSAGLVAIGATVAVERLGGRLGGLLGTLPTTIVPAAAGIWTASSDPDAFVASMAAVPVGMWVNVLFLLVWREAPARLPKAALSLRLALMVCVSLAVWAVVATAAVFVMSQLENLGITAMVPGVCCAGLSLTFGLWSTWRPRPAPKGKRTVGSVTLAARGVLAAAAISGAVLLASVAGPLISGVASVFPAIFLTSMVSLWWSQGEAVQGGAVGPMMLGSTAVSVYAIFAAFLLPIAGVATGSVIAWALSVVIITLPAFGWIQWRLRIGLSVSA
ncbi:MAG: hypothetical protein CL927_08025 [Deltaproteobacteria bacterium]|nr:hypothetical protein [Deltaproteobacteria bacterium]